MFNVGKAVSVRRVYKLGWFYLSLSFPTPDTEALANIE